MNWIDKIIEAAQKLGGLTPAAIFALGNVLQGAYIYKTLKEGEAWRGIREKQIASETMQSEVLKQLITEVAGLKMMFTKYLLKE